MQAQLIRRGLGYVVLAMSMTAAVLVTSGASAARRIPTAPNGDVVRRWNDVAFDTVRQHRWK